MKKEKIIQLIDESLSEIRQLRVEKSKTKNPVCLAEIDNSIVNIKERLAVLEDVLEDVDKNAK